MDTKRAIRFAVAIPVIVTGVFSIWLISSLNRLETPQPSGKHAVGRVRLNLKDDQRLEQFDPQHPREVIVEVWYPAKIGSGEAGKYFPELTEVSQALVDSGEISTVEAWALSLVSSHHHLQAPFADIPAACPVVLLSPGNATNVEFYTLIGDELASRGYVVLGLNHPYDVGAVRLSDGSIASYRERAFADHPALRARMNERVADVRFVFDSLVGINSQHKILAGRLDLTRVGVVGHSLGGMTAAEFCVVDDRPKICVNFDGLYGGNPYGASSDANAPRQPYMYIGKERTIDDRTRKLLESHSNAQLVSVPNATHETFTDGSLFKPTLWPWDKTTLRTLDDWRPQFVDFLDQHLKILSSGPR